MSIIESKKQPLDDQLFLCYNCGIEIIDKTQKFCPNCRVILNPNDYINWRMSWYIFMTLLCFLPIVIGILYAFFSK